MLSGHERYDRGLTGDGGSPKEETPNLNFVPCLYLKPLNDFPLDMEHSPQL